MAFDLASVLSNVSDSDTAREQIEYIKLDLIEEDPNNFYQLSGLEDLAANIQLCGLQQPIRVRPIPGESERYRIVSGHRRRAALALLAKENPERWSEAACIVEDDEVSPTLQQLRLIYANANTRTMTSAEISEQAVQVEKLLYQLKEEGYEFPGRMRDHVAQAVNASKTKLARLKVIREKLIKAWTEFWTSNKLSEDAAYKLAKHPPEYQQVIFDICSKKGVAENIQAGAIDVFTERFERIATLKCSDGKPCQNLANKRIEAVMKGRYDYCQCHICCAKCSKLVSCKYACPKLADRIKQLRAENKESRQNEKMAQIAKDQPVIDYIRDVYERFGRAREAAGVSVEEIYRRQKRFFVPTYEKDQRALEDGSGKITVNTDLPFGYSFAVSYAKQLCLTADAFSCSIDYLLGRTSEPRMAEEVAADDRVAELDDHSAEPEYMPGAWYPASVEPPVGVPLVLIDSGGYADTGKYKGCGEYTMDYGDPVVLWTLMPDEKGTAQTAPPVAGWQSGTPEGYGTYVTYVRIDGARKLLLQEMLWDGEEWLHCGSPLADGVTVACWAERPDF